MSFAFSMPFGESLHIRPSKEIDELEVEADEEIEGVVYNIYWNNIALPWHTKTRLQAISIALGCQWGAMETAKRIKDER